MRNAKKQESIPHTQEKKCPTENVTERSQIWDLVDRDFKAVILNIFTQLKEMIKNYPPRYMGRKMKTHVDTKVCT